MPRRIDTQAVIDAVRLEEQASDFTTPASGYGAIYGKTDGAMYYIGDDGIVRPGGIGEGASVYNSTDQSIPNNSGTALTFNSEYFDTNGYHSTVTNTDRLTVPVNGIYLVTSFVYFAANISGIRLLNIDLDGGADVIAETRIISLTNNVLLMITSGIAQLSASSYVRALVYQNSGGALNSVAANGAPRFSIYRIG